MGDSKENNSPSPYMDARREWNERYGGYISSAKTWKRIAFISLTIAAGSVGGVVYIGSQSKFIPVVVEVNQSGKTLKSYRANIMQPAEPSVMQAEIGQFITDVRTVTADKTLQKRFVYRAFTHLTPKFPAHTAVSQWYQKNVPFKRAETETVTVEIKQILPLTGDTWRVEWTERSRNRKGMALKPKQWSGTMTVVVSGVVDEKTILDSPIGLFVKEFDWSEDLSQGRG